MGLLRENKDTLMTVLDAFIHDPLVEWEDEKRKIVSSEEIWFQRGSHSCIYRSDK
jgi:phosphatidylinositol kinase/protein kinase (PI-3  family)